MTAALTQTAPRPWAHRLATPGPTLLLLLGFAILVAISASSITLIHRARSDAESVAHTLRVMNAVSQLQVLIRRTESAERGYLITGREGFARFYQQSKAQTGPTLEEIATLTADNPEQQQRVAEARTLIAERLASYEQSMALRTAGDLEGAVADLRADRTEGAMTRLGTLLVEMKAAETELLDERTDASHDSTVWLTVVSLAGLAVVLALG
ncbi:MAG: CHASE3 domain-containing protein, partial [Rhizobiales bacterium]|nr:CHASE3 domain-containing protein [Hyphomicrobiales bacterium]